MPMMSSIVYASSVIKDDGRDDGAEANHAPRARPVATVFRTRIDRRIVVLQGPPAVGVWYLSARVQLLIKTGHAVRCSFCPALMFIPNMNTTRDRGDRI